MHIYPCWEFLVGISACNCHAAVSPELPTAEAGVASAPSDASPPLPGLRCADPPLPQQAQLPASIPQVCGIPPSGHSLTAVLSGIRTRYVANTQLVCSYARHHLCAGLSLCAPRFACCCNNCQQYEYVCLITDRGSKIHEAQSRGTITGQRCPCLEQYLSRNWWCS